MINTTLPLLLIVAAIVAGSNYRVIWYHTEFWIKDKSQRRPFTYMLRDLYHDQPLIVCFLLAWAGYALGRWIMPIDHILLFCGGLLMGHLFWTEKYIPGQQETPEYDPDNDTIELTTQGESLVEDDFDYDPCPHGQSMCDDCGEKCKYRGQYKIDN